MSQKTRKKAKRKKPTRKKNQLKKKRTKKKMAPTTNQNLKLRKNLLCWIIWNPWKVKFTCLLSWVRKQHRRRKIQRLVSNSVKSMQKKKLVLFTDISCFFFNFSKQHNFNRKFIYFKVIKTNPKNFWRKKKEMMPKKENQKRKGKLLQTNRKKLLKNLNLLRQKETCF